MKHLILTSALFLTATLGFAQNITEPEYKGQVAVINADSTTTLLQKETGEHKAKSSAFALVPIPGASLLDRTKAYLTVKGAESPNKISSKKFSLIIRVKDNSEEPKICISHSKGLFLIDPFICHPTVWQRFLPIC